MNRPLNSCWKKQAEAITGSKQHKQQNIRSDMKTKTGWCTVMLAAVILWVGASTSALASLVWTFGAGGAFSGAGPNNSDWLQATVERVNPKAVSVTLDWLNVPDSTKLLGFYMNYAGDNLSTLTVSGPSGLSVNTGSDSFKADGVGGYFDLLIQAQSKGQALFSASDSPLTFTISSSSRLNLDDFNVFSVTKDGENTPWNAAAQIAGYGNSVWVGVPEPTTLVAGLLLLIPFTVSVLKVLRKNQCC